MRPLSYVVVVLLLTVVVLDHRGSTPRVTDAAVCEVLKLSMCQAMPYNVTLMPNLLHHVTQLNAGLVLDQFQPLVDSGCSNGTTVTSSTHGVVIRPSPLVFYLCSMFAPVCPRKFGRRLMKHRRQSLYPALLMRSDVPIPPCRAVCERARADCEPIMIAHGIRWPDELNCSSLPNFDTGVCISPDAIDTSTATHRDSQGCRCNQTMTASIRKVYMQRKFDYVIRATLRHSSKRSDGSRRLTVRIIKVIKRCSALPASSRRIQKLVLVWPKTDCPRCRPTMRRQTDYIIMGHENQRKKRLLFDDSTIALPWRNRWPQLVQTWESQLNKSRGRHGTATNVPDMNNVTSLL